MEDAYIFIHLTRFDMTGKLAIPIHLIRRYEETRKAGCTTIYHEDFEVDVVETYDDIRGQIESWRT